MTSEEFCSAINLSQSSLYNKLRGEQDWRLWEIINIIKLMKKNKIKGKLLVSVDGDDYEVAVTHI